jgi:hypothetical protein
MFLFLALAVAVAIIILMPRAEGDESIGYGATLKINDGTASAFVTVPKLTKLGIPNETTGTAESKTLDLPEAVIRKLPTLKDGGTFVFSYEVIGATYDRVEAIRSARAIKQFQVSVPVDTGDIEITVEGYVSQNPMEDVEADKITIANATVVVSGPQIPGDSSIMARKESAVKTIPRGGVKLPRRKTTLGAGTEPSIG